MAAYRVPTHNLKLQHKQHAEPDRAKIKRHLLMGASVLALVASSLAAGPNSALAFTCDSVTNPAGGNGGANDGGLGTNTACGTVAIATGGNSTAVGRNAQSGTGSTAVGESSAATGTDSVAVGRSAGNGSSATNADNSDFGFAAGEVVQGSNNTAGRQPGRIIDGWQW